MSWSRYHWQLSCHYGVTDGSLVGSEKQRCDDKEEEVRREGYRSDGGMVVEEIYVGGSFRSFGTSRI